MRAPRLLLFSLLALTASVLAQDTDAPSEAIAAPVRTLATGAPATATVGTTTSQKASLPGLSSSSKNAAPTDTAAPSSPEAPVSGGPPYSTPIVTPPSAKNAPFMKPYNFPEGTVFIAVGAALALCALIVLAWRGLVAWSLHRSVKRATKQPLGIIESKPMTHMGGKPTGGGGFYAVGPGSTLSLDHLAGSNRSPGPNGSLFFSPTSNTVLPLSPGTGSNIDRRSSTYLPSGYYAAGNRKSQSSPSNSSQTQFPRPMRAPGVSPPGTPLMSPASRGAPSTSGTERMSGMRVNDSQTSLNLPPTGRAPSAYLEDLFESHNVLEQGQSRYN